MYYLRFLKPPKLAIDVPDGPTVRLVVTIVTDLGDDFFHGPASLAATARTSQDSPAIGHKIDRWQKGMRALPINLKLETSAMDAPFRIFVDCPELTSDVAKANRGSVILPPIFSVASAIIDIGSLEADKLALRILPLQNEQQICIYEDTGESIAHHLWDAGVALSLYINHNFNTTPTTLRSLDRCIAEASISSLQVIELGTGCGLVGITLAKTLPNCQVLLTDIDDAASHNIPLNLSNVTYCHLNWSNDIPATALNNSFDLILAADCIYNPDSSPGLVATISRLHNRSKGAVILIASKTRHSSEAVFFELMQKEDFIQQDRISVVSPCPFKEGSYGDVELIDLYTFTRLHSRA